MNQIMDRLRALIELGYGDRVADLLWANMKRSQQNNVVAGLRDMWAEHLLDELGRRQALVDKQILAVQQEANEP